MINGWREWFQKRMERGSRQAEFASIDARRFSNNNSRTYEMLQSPAKNVDGDGTVIRCPNQDVTSGSGSSTCNNDDNLTITTRIFSVPVANTVNKDIVRTGVGADEKTSKTDDMNDGGDGSDPSSQYPSAGTITTTNQAATSTGNNTTATMTMTNGNGDGDGNNNSTTIYRSPMTNLSYSTPRPPPPISPSSSSSLRSPRASSIRPGRGREWDPKDTHAPSMANF